MTEPVPDIAVLFARDPEKMTDADISAIVEKYRANRHLFQSGGGTGVKKAVAPKLTAGESKVAAALGGLSLDFKL